MVELHGPLKTNPATGERRNLPWCNRINCTDIIKGKTRSIQYLTCFFCLLELCLLSCHITVCWQMLCCRNTVCYVVALLYLVWKSFFSMGFASLIAFNDLNFLNVLDFLFTLFVYCFHPIERLCARSIDGSTHLEPCLHASHIF